MIDPNRTLEEMLDEIDASPQAGASPLYDPLDPRFVSRDEACLRVRGNTPDELLPILRGAFSRRFTHVPEEQLSADLLYLLKKGLGNAYKWGNHKDASKAIAVEAVVTKAGALVALTDEGEGFEVESVVGRLERGEGYFTHGGSGFAHFARSKSVISYADGGRTLLIRFRCAPEPGRALRGAERTAGGLAGDEAFMASRLRAHVPLFRDGGATLEACRIYAAAAGHEGRVELRYLVSYRENGTSAVRDAVWSGRLLPPTAAKTEFAVAKQLSALPQFNRPETGGVHVPEPVAAFESPPLVLFEYQAGMDLHDYVRDAEDEREVARTLARVATGLRAFHRSPVALRVVDDLREETERDHLAAQRVRVRLSDTSTERGDRMERVVRQWSGRAGAIRAYERVPIHGSFGLRSVWRDDRGLHLSRFDASRYSHPGIDVGDFLADVLRLLAIGKHAARGRHDAGRDAFLETYFAGVSSPWRDDIPWFMVGALFRHLERLLTHPEKKWEARVDGMLEACEGLLQGAGS